MTLEEYQAAIERVVNQGGLWTEGRVAEARRQLDAIRRAVLDEMTRLAPNAGPYQMWNLQTVLRAIDEAARDLQSDLLPLFLLASAAAWRRAQAGLQDLGIDYGGDIPEMIALSQTMRDLARTLDERLRASLRDIVLRGIAAQTPPAAIMRQVRDAFDRIERDIAAGTRTNLSGILSLSYYQHQQQAYERDKSLYKLWSGILDERIRPAHLEAHFRYNAKPIPFEQDFIVGGERCSYPHDPRLSLGNRLHCRCLSWVVKKEMLGA